MILDPQSELFHSSTCLQVLPDHVPLSLGSAGSDLWGAPSSSRRGRPQQRHESLPVPCLPYTLTTQHTTHSTAQLSSLLALTPLVSYRLGPLLPRRGMLRPLMGHVLPSPCLFRRGACSSVVLAQAWCFLKRGLARGRSPPIPPSPAT